MKKECYLESDMKRAFLSVRFPGSVACVTATLFFSLYRMADIVSVYRAYMDAVYFIPFVLTLTFCTIPYAESFSEDVRHKYIQPMLLRGGIKKYVISKILTVYISSVLTMILGVAVFILLVKTRVPWSLAEDYLYPDILTETLFKQGYHVLFFLIHSFFLGLLAGNLSVLAAYLALYWNEKLFVMSVPFLVYYILVYYAGQVVGNNPWLDIRQIFNVSYNINGSSAYSLLWALGISLVFLIVMGICSYRKLRRLCNA